MIIVLDTLTHFLPLLVYGTVHNVEQSVELLAKKKKNWGKEKKHHKIFFQEILESLEIIK